MKAWQVIPAPYSFDNTVMAAIVSKCTRQRQAILVALSLEKERQSSGQMGGLGGPLDNNIPKTCTIRYKYSYSYVDPTRRANRKIIIKRCEVHARGPVWPAIDLTLCCVVTLTLWSQDSLTPSFPALFRVQLILSLLTSITTLFARILLT